MIFYTLLICFKNDNNIFYEKCFKIFYSCTVYDMRVDVLYEIYYVIYIKKKKKILILKTFSIETLNII